MRAIHVTHRLGVVGVPRHEVGRRVVGLVATPERMDERLLDGRGAVRAGARRRDLDARLLERRREVDRVERLPLLVVVRPDRVGDAPVGEREAGIVLDRALEAPDRLLVVERVGPHESTVEPRLGARRGRRRLTRVSAEIEVRLHRLAEGMAAHRRSVCARRFTTPPARRKSCGGARAECGSLSAALREAPRSPRVVVSSTCPEGDAAYRAANAASAPARASSRGTRCAVRPGPRGSAAPADRATPATPVCSAWWSPATEVRAPDAASWMLAVLAGRPSSPGPRGIGADRPVEEPGVGDSLLRVLHAADAVH